jgi:AsmA protein
MRKTFLVGGIAIAVLIAGAFILLATLNVNQFRGTIQADLEQQLHRPVTLGNMSLGLFPLSIRASNVQIGETASFPTGKLFVTVREIRVRAELMPLLRKQVRVRSLELEQPSIELVDNAAHQWNYSDLTGQSSGGGSSGSMTLSSLQINDGSVAVSDLGVPSSRAVYDHINLQLTDFAPGQVFHVKASAQLPGAKADSVVLEGSGGPAVNSGLPFNGRFSLTQAPVAALGRFSGMTLPVDGALSGGADIRTANAVTSIQGNLVLDHASVHGAAIGIPIRLDYNIADDSRSDVLEAQSARITAGSVVITSTARIDNKLHTINATAHTANANIAELLALARVLGAGNANGSGTLSLDATISGPLKGALNCSGNASIPDARITTGSSSGAVTIRNAKAQFNGSTANISADSLSSQGLVLTNLRTTAALNRGVVALSPVNAQIFGGSAAGPITIDTNPDPQALALNLQLDGVDANQLLSATTSVKNTIYGSLAASTNLKLRLYSASDAIARSMNGTLALNLTKGHLSGVNVMNELASIGKFVGYSVNPQNLTTIVKLSGDLGIINGVANTKNLQLQMEGGSLAAAGSINLADQSLNLKTTAVIDRPTSQKAGGNSVGGFMQTALANSNGELVIPAMVTGSFAHPHFAPDIEQMAQMRLKNLLPTASSPGKALTNILGGSKAPANSQPIGNAVDNALDSLFNRKKK